jgi:hypothetical protein
MDERSVSTSRTGEPVYQTTGGAAGVTERRTVDSPIGRVRQERATHHDDEIAIPEALGFQRDQVRWGPIFAGVMTALTSLLLLSLLGVAVGLTTVNAGVVAAQGTPPPDAGRNAALWSALSGVFAFLTGGYVAGRTAGVFDRKWGALNGALVFVVGVPLILWLAGQGLGAVLGSLGGFASALNVDPTQAQNAANQAASQTTPLDVARAASQAKTTVWMALIGTLLWLGAGAIGGLMGTRRTLDVETMVARSEH